MAKCRKALALLLTVLMVFSLLPMTIAAENSTESTEPVWPAEGSINLVKEAQAVKGQDNLWEVTLSIQGKNFKTTSDVVLVIDCSGSMEGTKLENTRKAAKAFGDKLLTNDSSTRIAIVTYIDEATAYNNGHFYGTDELDAFKTAVDKATYANGGTNQQAGIHVAQELLSSEASTGKLKNIVILSDGEATYSYSFVATATYSDCEARTSLDCPRGGSVTNIGTFAPDYNQIVGRGNSFTMNYNAQVTATCPKHGESTTRDYVYSLDGTYTTTRGTNNGVATIWEANQAKAAGTTVFSVALQAGTNGEETLKACATDAAKGYYAIGKDDNVETKLTSAFEAIAGSIAIAARNGVAIDPMGEKVQLSISGSAPVITNNLDEYTSGTADVYYSQGAVTYDKDTRTINWTVGNVSEGDNPIMKYKVTVKDGYNPSTGEVLDTNGRTTFTYINYKDENTVKDFPIPQVTVGGGNILVHYYMVNAKGEPINENGVVVEDPSLAKQVKAAEYWSVNDKTGLSYNTAYTVAKTDITDYTYYGYVLNNEELVKETESVDVTLTAANSNQHVWFAYTQGFEVVHVQNGVAGEPVPYTIGDTIQGVYEAGKFNLTAVVPEGYLYGGSFTKEECTTPQTYATGENPTSFTPVAGATYYIWEVDAAYLMPKSLSCWEHNTDGLLDVMGFFVVTPIDREYYKEVGFTVNENTVVVANQVSEEYVDNDGKVLIKETDKPVLYQTIRILKKDGSFDEFSIEDVTNPAKTGYLACASLAKETYWNDAETDITFTPYWITLDGVTVTNATRTCRYLGAGDSAEHKKIGKISESESKPTTDVESSTQVLAEPLMVYASFIGGSTVVDLVDPVDPVDPVEPIDPVDPEEPDDGTITVTVNDNGSVYELALLPGDISGEIEYLGVSGCLFAGWYTDEAYVEPADFTYVTEDITIYAKYVSDAYLQVQYQQKRMSLKGGKATLISAVDSYAYAETGFVINGETLPVTPRDGSRQYYDIRWLFGNGVEKKSPILTTEISAGDYSVGDTIEVTPYWITMDGTTVYGASRTLTIARTGFKG